MTKSEWENLVRSLAGSGGGSAGPATDLLRALQGAAPQLESAIPRPATALSPIAQSGGVGGTLLRSIGIGAVMSPVIGGLIRLFGGGKDEEPDAEPIPFSLPESLRLEAGLGADGSLSQVSYGQGGLARFAPNRAPEPQTAKPANANIQINVQAMDSKSFLDHRDEIAQAVREAMLQSHALNDVVAEV